MSRLNLTRWLAGFAPARISISWRERARSSGGALFGIALTGLLAHWLLGTDATVPFLIAPMGASAVLLFAVPASPLAQPWSIIGGNLVSSTVGVTCALLIHDPVEAAAVAIALAIAGMFALRCVHPPSGAVALTAVLGGPAVRALGYEFVFEPVALQSAVLLGSALVYHAATGHRYPHVAVKPADRNAPAQRGFSRDDLEAVLRGRDEMLDVDPRDLEAVLREAEIRAYARTFGELTCAEVMTHDVISISPDTTVREARRLLRRHDIKALPVVDAQRNVKGIVTRANLADGERNAHPGRRLAARAARWLAPLTGMDEPVHTLMSAPVRTVATTTPIADLLAIFAGRGHHHVPVVDAHKRLAGIVTQADLISGLYRQSQSELPLAA
ncbi:HPP family protein [Paraburkholderia adhaesiva]|uniref:HPP family protein n=1 Tax=Paraburkholderia adhaesiva TaxID=2883244 RepID=UPI001F2F589D|nr:HPP family protein [Paraburkholderia adhaesiva]